METAREKELQKVIDGLKIELEESWKFANSLKELTTDLEQKVDRVRNENEALKKANDIMVNSINTLEKENEDTEKDLKILILESKLEVYEQIVKLWCKAE